MLIVSYPKEPVVPFSPDQLSGLEIWLDASDASTVTTVDDGGTDRVSAWASKAGAARSFDQGTVTNRPEYVAGEYLDFDGSRFLTLAETSGLDWSDGTLVCVYEAADDGSGKFLFEISSGGSGRLIFNVGNTELGSLTVIADSLGVVGLLTPRTDLATFVGHWEDGVSLTLESDTPETSTDLTYSGPTLDYTNITIGQRANNTNRYSGRIHEIMFWQTRRTPSEISQIFDYTAAKWPI